MIRGGTVRKEDSDKEHFYGMGVNQLKNCRIH